MVKTILDVGFKSDVLCIAPVYSQKAEGPNFALEDAKRRKQHILISVSWAVSFEKASCMECACKSWDLVSQNNSKHPPRHSMGNWYIYRHERLFSMVYVGKYTIHGICWGSLQSHLTRFTWKIWRYLWVEVIKLKMQTVVQDGAP